MLSNYLLILVFFGCFALGEKTDLHLCISSALQHGNVIDDCILGNQIQSGSLDKAEETLIESYSARELAKAFLSLRNEVQTMQTMFWEEWIPANEPIQFSMNWNMEDEDASARAALFSLFEATGGPESAWKNNSGWGRADVLVCAWYGVICEGNTVAKLSLGGNGLVGKVPSAFFLGNATWLNGVQVIDLSSNQLYGEMSVSWCNFVNLEEFLLDNNQFSGSLPVEWHTLAHLKVRRNLGIDLMIQQLLRLNGNKLTGILPSEWSSLQNLLELDLSLNPLNGSTLPDSWGNMTSLRRLTLRRLGISSFPNAWVGMKNLQKLDMGDNQLTSFWQNGTFWREHWTDLRSLNISSNALEKFTCVSRQGWIRGMPFLYLANNNLKACPDFSACRIAWLDIALNPMQGSCSFTHPFDDTLAVLFASDTQLDDFGTLPSTLRILSAWNSPNLKHLEPSGTHFDFYSTQHAPNLRSPNMIRPKALSNYIWSEYIGTNDGLYPMLEYSALTDVVVKGVTMNYRCPQIISKYSGGPASLDPSFYDYFACACIPGMYGLPPNCALCPLHFNCSKIGAVCPPGEQGYWIEYKHPGAKVVDVPKSTEDWSGLVVWRDRCVVVALDHLTPLVFSCVQIAYKKTACNPPSNLSVWRDNTCLEGYTGRACSQCVTDYGHVGTKCKKCSPYVDWLFPLLLVIGIVGTIVWMLMMDQTPSETKEGGVSVVLFVLQALSMLDNLNVPLPSGGESVLPPLLEWVKFGVLKPECLNMSLGGEAVLTMASPWILAFIPFVLLYFGKGRVPIVWKERCRFAIAFSFYATFVPVVTTATSMMRCHPLCNLPELPDGCLLHALYYPCPWKANWGLGAVLILGLMTHVGAIFFLMMAQNISQSESLQFLVTPYRPKFQNWEWVNTSMKILFALGIGVLGVSSPVFVPLIGGGLGLIAAAVWRWKPYRCEQVNLVSSFSLFSLAIVFAGTSLLLLWPQETSQPQIYGPVLYALAVVTLVSCVVWLVWKSKKKNMRELNEALLLGEE